MRDPADGGGWTEARAVCLRVARRYYRGDPVEAEDVAQEALLRAWRRESSLRDPSRQCQWLAAIARNEAFRHNARRRPEPIPDADAGEGTEDARVVATADRADLQAALARLPSADRRLLHLHYAEDMTHAAIARLLGIPVGTVKVRLHRARAKLRMAHG